MHKKNIYYYIAILVFTVSILGIFLAYQTFTAKEKKIGSMINIRLNNLENIQKRISDNIKSIKNIELPVLRYGYSFNENDDYFMSEIVRASKKYNVKSRNIKLIRTNKKKNTAEFIFKVKGLGKPEDIYSFIKTLEYNHKIELKKFYISKNFNSKNEVYFSSILAAYVINKHEILPDIVKVKAKLLPPDNFGKIDPFKYSVEAKKPVKKIISKPSKKIAENVYKKLSEESRIKQSDFYNKEGVRFFDKNNLSKAYVMFKKAVMLNPDNYMALSNAALDSYKTENYNDSILYAKKALKLKKLWQINFILGLAYLHIENFSKANFNFNEALKLNPSDEQIKYYLNISKKRR